MSKINLRDTLSGYNLSVINQNFDTLAEALNDQILYRQNPDGTPNEMEDLLDMNGNRIINLPAPLNGNEAARLKDVTDAIAGAKSAALTSFEPYGSITSTNVQGAIQQVIDGITFPSIVVDSIAALRTVSKIVFKTAFVQGYYTKGDGGVQNNFYYDSADTTSADNGGTIIVAVDGGRWKILASAITTKMFGCKADGTTNDAVAFGKCADYCMLNGLTMNISKGKYNLQSATVTTFPGAFSTVAGFHVVGAGIDNTILYYPTLTDGWLINYNGPYNSLLMENVTFARTGSAAHFALKLNQTAASMPNPALNALSEIRNCCFRGNDGYVIGDAWQQGLWIYGVSNVNVTSCNFLGNAAFGGAGEGIRIEGTAALPPVAFNIIGCNFSWNDTAITYGDRVQGVSVVSSNFVGGNYGIVSQAGLIELDQLTVTASQFNQIIANIHCLTNIANVMINNNEFIVQNNAIGINLPSGGFFTITGNTIAGNGFTGTNGIIVNNSTASGIITGNAFLGMNTAVFLQSGSTTVNVQSNAYSTCTNKVVNMGIGNTVGGGSI